MASFSPDLSRPELALTDKIRAIQWGFVLMIAAIAGIAFAMLYSAANGNLQPWASHQMARFAIALVPMIAPGIVGVPSRVSGPSLLPSGSPVLCVACVP